MTDLRASAAADQNHDAPRQTVADLATIARDAAAAAAAHLRASGIDHAVTARAERGAAMIIARHLDTSVVEHQRATTPVVDREAGESEPRHAALLRVGDG